MQVYAEREEQAHGERDAEHVVDTRPDEISSYGSENRAGEVQRGDDVIRLADATRNAYRTVVVRGDRLAGGVLFGDLAAVGTLARTWQDDDPLPADMSLLHLLTNDGGF